MATQKVGVLAVQGAFAEHESALRRLGAQPVQLRQASDLEKGFDRLILPGGESTAQGRILRDLDMLDALRHIYPENAGMFQDHRTSAGRHH